MSSLNLVEDYSVDRKYLNCDVSGRTDIINFEVKMLDNNSRIPGLVSMFKSVQNEQMIFRYDITGLIPIKHYFGSLFSKNQLLTLIMGFCLVDETITEYMLRSEGLCTSFDKIFVEQSTGAVKMIYLPIQESINDENISMLQCTNIVINSVAADLSEDAGYYEVWKQMAGDSNLNSLQALKKKIEAFEERKENSVKIMQEKAEEEKEKVRKEAEKREKIQQEVIAQQNQANSKKKLGIFGNNDKKIKNSKSISTDCSEPLVSEIAIPGGGSIAIPGGESTPDPKEKKKKEKSQKEKPVKEKKGIFGKKTKNHVAVKYEAANEQMDLVRNQEEQEKSEQAYVTEERLHTILDTTRKEYMPDLVQEVSLQRKKAWLTNSAGVRTEVSKLPFIVGRQSGIADLIIKDNLEIGRQHMIITYSEGTYFVSDNRSTNHTYLNGNELPPDVPCPVMSGDVIVLGQEEASVAFRFQSE